VILSGLRDAMHLCALYRVEDGRAFDALAVLVAEQTTLLADRKPEKILYVAPHPLTMTKTDSIDRVARSVLRDRFDAHGRVRYESTAFFCSEIVCALGHHFQTVRGWRVVVRLLCRLRRLGLMRPSVWFGKEKKIVQ